MHHVNRTQNSGLCFKKSALFSTHTFPVNPILKKGEGAATLWDMNGVGMVMTGREGGREEPGQNGAAVKPAGPAEEWGWGAASWKSLVGWGSGILDKWSAGEANNAGQHSHREWGDGSSMGILTGGWLLREDSNPLCQGQCGRQKSCPQKEPPHCNIPDRLLPLATHFGPWLHMQQAPRTPAAFP